MAFSRTLALALIFVTAGTACGEEVHTIPLSEIWALDMPRTRDINEYDFSYDDPRIEGPDLRPGVRTFSNMLQAKLWLQKIKQDVLPILVLRQKGPSRLLPMLRVAGSTVNKKETLHRIRFQELGERFLTPREDYRFSLFFYSYVSGYRVELVQVERQGLEIDIQYRFVPRFSTETSAHWALIPLGELPAGDYHVNITKLPMGQQFLDAGFQPVSEEHAKRIVCQPLDFFIRYKPEEEVIDEEEFSGETVVIPLDQIWAYRMPGTRPMNASLGRGVYVAAEGPMLGEIRRALVQEPVKGTSRPIQWKDAKPGFAVLGTGMDALRESHAVLVEKQEPRKSFPVDTEITLVFFSYDAGSYVHFHRVDRLDNVVEIRYQFVPHYSSDASEHFALIPLGKLPAGKQRVNVIQSPLQQKHVDKFGVQPLRPEWGRRIVCKSFSFSVTDQDNE